MNITKTTPAVASNLQALPNYTGGIGHQTAAQKRLNIEINDWLEAQDKAEVSFLVAEMAMRNNRTNRLSAYG